MRPQSGFVAALAVLWLGSACSDLEHPVQPRKMEPGATPRVPAGLRFSNAVWTANLAECIQCHGSAPFPAGIDLTSPTSLQASQVQLLYDGVASERAPAAGAPLAGAVRDSILRWAVGNGARPYAVSVPASYSWSMEAQLAGAAVGSNAAAPGRFFGFRIEDLRRTTSLLVDEYTDGSGRRLRGLALFDQTAVDPDSFLSSTHPVNYVVIDGVPWNGRWRELRFAGYVTVDRWAFVTFHTRLLQKGPSPYGARQRREYVRLQIDRDWMSWRSKVPPADGTETYPWAGADPLLRAAPGQTLDAPTGYLNPSKWYRVEGSIAAVGGAVRYQATLVDPATGAVLCRVGADRTDVERAYGSVTFGKYSESGGTAANPKRTRFAAWTFEVEAMLGAGGEAPPGRRHRRPRGGALRD